MRESHGKVAATMCVVTLIILIAWHHLTSTQSLITMGKKRLLITDLDPHVLLLWLSHYKECFDDKALFSSCISSKRAREEYCRIY